MINFSGLAKGWDINGMNLGIILKSVVDMILRLRILRQRKGNECIGNEVEEWDINKVGSKKNE
jgi:hypothetical protein